MKANRLVLLALAGTLAPWVASADLYYWKGNATSDVTDTNLYLTTQYSMNGTPAQSLDGLSVSFSDGGQEVTFTDATMPVLMNFESFLHMSNTKIYIDVTNDYTFAFRCHRWNNSTVVKRGPGTIEFTNDGASDIDSSRRHNAFHESWLVEGGRVVFPQENLTSGDTYFLGNVAISNGAEVVLFGGRMPAGSKTMQIYLQGILSGEGTILQTNANVDTRFYISPQARDDFAHSAPFAGRLIAPRTEVRQSDACFTGVENNYGGNYISRFFSVRLFGKEDGKVSSMGAYTGPTTLNGRHVTLHNCATEADGPQTMSRRFTDCYNSASAASTVTFDAGAYGALTIYNGAIWPAFGLYMKELILTGSNTAESVFATQVQTRNVSDAAKHGYYYLTKRGTGTWRMTTDWQDSRTKIAGVGVEEGTLKFDSIAERGVACSLGLATNILGYAYQGALSAQPAEADYAIRLGTATNLTREGALVYSGSTYALCKTRPIGITGTARFGNDSEMDVVWKNVSTVLPPEGGTVPAANTLTLDGSAASGTIIGLSEGAGTGPLSLVKTGTGTWALDGDVDFSGSVEVRAGALNLRNYRTYPWFRFRVTETLGASTNCVTTKGQIGHYGLLDELGLFAADGTRLNSGLQRGFNTVGSAKVGMLPAGYVAHSIEMNDRTTEKLTALFDDLPGTSNDRYWFNVSNNGPISPTNEASQMPIVMHLADSTKRVARFDLAYPNSINGAYANAQPTQYLLEGSADGETWHTVCATNSIPWKKGQSWLYANVTVGAETSESEYLPIDASIPSTEWKTVLPNGLAKLSVAAGSSFAVCGAAIPVKALEIDAAGVGTIAGVSFPETGTIDIRAAERMENGTIAFHFTDVTGAANLANWNVTVNGVSDPHYILTPTATGVEVRRHGMIFILR